MPSGAYEALETHSTTCRNTLAEKEKLLKDLEYIDPLSMDYQHQSQNIIDGGRASELREKLAICAFFSINAGEIVGITGKMAQENRA